MRRGELSGAPLAQRRHRTDTFIDCADVERSHRFCTEVLGSTDDKPTVTLETPSDPDRVSSFLNIRLRISGRDGHLIEVGQAQR